MILKGNWWEFSCRNSINWSNKLRIRENVVIHAVNQIVRQYLFQMCGTPVSSTNETDRHDITEILLKVALNTIILTPDQGRIWDIQMYVLAQMCGFLEVLKCICPECLVGSKIFCFYAGGSMATVIFLGVQTRVGSHIDSYPINWDFCNSYTYIFFLAHLTQRVMWGIAITWRPSSVR